MTVINTNISSMLGLNNLRTTNTAMQTTLARLSSGMRINFASDDPSGLAIASNMGAQLGGMRMAVQNAEDGVSLIHTADGSLEQTGEILLRMRDLAVRASNEAVLTTADNARFNSEFASLKLEIERKTKSVTFNGKILFSSGFSQNATGTVQQTLQIGADNGTKFLLSVFIPKLGLSNLGLSDNAGATYINLSNPTQALNAISAVNAAINTISNARASLGIQERRLNHIINDLNTADINISAAKSRIMDADMAVEISEFTRLQILQQSGTAILAQANAQPQSILQLLK